MSMDVYGLGLEMILQMMMELTLVSLPPMMYECRFDSETVTEERLNGE